MADSESSHPIISRKEAIRRGLKYYFTGKRCKRGHLSLRLVSGLSCVTCDRQKVKAWRAANPQRDRNIAAAWRNKNRESINRQYRQRYAKDPTTFRLKARTYYRKYGDLVRSKRRIIHHLEYERAEVREAARRRTREWALANPERAKQNTKISKHRRRSRERNAVGSFTRADLSELFKQQRGRCVYCRVQLDPKGIYHVDHIVPLAKGGSNNPDNLQLLCMQCNLQKGARDAMMYARARGLLL